MRTLYIVATPIGNLNDISKRAIDILAEVNAIACENPSHTLKLLTRFGIRQKKLLPYRESNRKIMIPKIIELLKEDDVALVVDAGTPVIADPGAELVAAAHRLGIKVVAIPGPSALIAALSISGVRADRFLFLGFLPRKEGELKREIQRLKEQSGVGVAYEAPHRISKTLAILADSFPKAKVVLVKEISKIHEEVFSGEPREILNQLAKNPKELKGEFVLILDFK